MSIDRRGPTSGDWVVGIALLVLGLVLGLLGLFLEVSVTICNSAVDCPPPPDPYFWPGLLAVALGTVLAGVGIWFMGARKGAVPTP